MDELPKTLLEAVRFFSNLKVCNDLMRRLKWPSGKVVCPHCDGDRCAEKADGKRLRCKDCRKDFSFKVGTIFEDSPLGLDKWFVTVWCIANAKNGISSCELGRALGVTQKTAWFLLHRIKLAQEIANVDATIPAGVEIRSVSKHPEYFVGNDGSIWSRRKSKLNPSGSLRQLKPQRHSAGYHCFTVRLGGGRQAMLTVHRCVLESFVGPCPAGQEARHLDGNRCHNWLTNLAWGTTADNHADRERHGTVGRGERHASAKMTKAQVIETRRMRTAGAMHKDIAAALGINISTIKSAVKGKSWSSVA